MIPGHWSVVISDMIISSPISPSKVDYNLTYIVSGVSGLGISNQHEMPVIDCFIK